MENKAHYALIGTFVLLAMIATIFFVSWLAGSQFDQAYDEFTVEFNGPVRGLSKGSEVRLNGLNVGEVSRLSFEPTNPNQVFVTVRVIDGAPIFKDGFAQLEPLGLTGLNYIQINPGNIGSSRMIPESDRIQGRGSQFDTIIEGGGNIIDGTTLAIKRVNDLMSEEAINDFQLLIKNLSEISGNWEDADLDMRLVEDVLRSWTQAGKDLSETVKSVSESSAAINQMVEQDLKPVFDKLAVTLETSNQTLKNFSELAESGKVTSNDLRDAVNRLANSGLTDLEETTDALRELMITLNEIADQLERSPAQFLAGEESEVMEFPL